MVLYNAYAIDGTYMGKLTKDGITKLFELAPSAHFTVHGGTSEEFWAGSVASGEYNRLGWYEFLAMNQQHA